MNFHEASTAPSARTSKWNDAVWRTATLPLVRNSHLLLPLSSPHWNVWFFYLLVTPLTVFSFLAWENLLLSALPPGRDLLERFYLFPPPQPQLCWTLLTLCSLFPKHRLCLSCCSCPAVGLLKLMLLWDTVCKSSPHSSSNSSPYVSEEIRLFAVQVYPLCLQVQGWVKTVQG